MTVKEAIENALKWMECEDCGRTSNTYKDLAAAYDALADQPAVMQTEIRPVLEKEGKQ